MKRMILGSALATVLAGAVSAGDIVAGERFSLASDLGGDRTIRVHLPQAVKAPVTVIYVLDGERLFAPVASFCDYFAGVRNAKAQGCMVVGIDAGGKERRTTDLTPTASAAGRDGKVAEGAKAVGGGADAFLSFVTKTVVPAAEAKLPASAAVTRRILAGHSFGGLFVLNAMTKADGTFTGFVAVDPSLWWDQSRFYQSFAKKVVAAGNKALSGASLYLGYGAALRKANQVHMENARSVETDWGPALEKAGVTVTQRFFTEENHGTVAIPGLYDALKKLLLTGRRE